MKHGPAKGFSKDPQHASIAICQFLLSDLIMMGPYTPNSEWKYSLFLPRSTSCNCYCKSRKFCGFASFRCV